MQRTVDVLEAQTTEYWKVSSLILGRTKGRITVEGAINKVNDLESHLGPHRALFRIVKSLGAVVVEGKRIKKPMPATITMLQTAGGTK